MKVVHPKALQDKPRPADIVKSGIDKSPDLFGGYDQIRENRIGRFKGITQKCFLGITTENPSVFGNIDKNARNALFSQILWQ
jgi:hypothetical protein